MSTIINGGVTTHVVRTPDGQLLSERVVGSTTADSYYLTDGEGSVTALTDQKGNIQNQYSYDPYGTVIGTPQETVPNSFRYVGAVWDASDQLYKMGARYYSSSLARFTQQDPATCSHTRNSYT